MIVEEPSYRRDQGEEGDLEDVGHKEEHWNNYEAIEDVAEEWL